MARDQKKEGQLVMIETDENSNWGWKEKGGYETHCTNRSTRLNHLALREREGSQMIPKFESQLKDGRDATNPFSCVSMGRLFNLSWPIFSLGGNVNSNYLTGCFEQHL